MYVSNNCNHSFITRTILASPGRFCITLNVDCLNPFHEAPYSTGAICLLIQNLPRTERYNVENIMLLGIILGPKKPKTMDYYLKPLVANLNKLFHHMKVKNLSPCLEKRL